MPVTLDCAAALGPTGKLEPSWLVRCDTDGCHHRSYFFGEDEEVAALKASAWFGWVRDSDGRIWCREHGHG